jgi:hypothetical protein
MPRRLREISKVGRAVAETDAWIDDLAQRLGWRDRDKTYAALIGALHGLRDALPRDEVVYLGAQLTPLLRAAGARAPVARRKASTRFAHAFTRPSTTIRASIRKPPPALFSLCLRPACRRARSRM